MQVSVFSKILLLLSCIFSMTLIQAQEVHPSDKSVPDSLPDAPIEAYSLTTPSPVKTTIQVRADAENTSSNSAPFHATAEQILSSAGTFGDFSRYLQTFPGVVFSSDLTNEILVRGGNPIENLYLVDGIEVPNINHISTFASTGGLTSMIDTAAISSVNLITGGYDASYQERLSSVVDIRVRGDEAPVRRTQADFGIVGAGAISEIPLSSNSALLVSAHRSLLNLFTNDIGLDGVPIYTNELVRAEIKPDSFNEITILSLGGIDSIDIHPNPTDPQETEPFDTQYRGWRTTNGLRWQHLYSNQTFGVLTISDSEQSHNIQQQDQLPLTGPVSYADSHIPVYSELSMEGATTLKYDYMTQLMRQVTLVTGAQGRATRINYNVAQPIGQQSPFSVDPTRSDATTFHPIFTTGDTASFLQLTWKVIKPLSISVGGRLQTFALGGRVTSTPRVSSIYRITDHTTLHASFGEYAQLPPTIYLFAFPQNNQLTPIRARHWIFGSDLWTGSRGRVSLEIYRKNYRNYPVSTEYPALSLANMVDTLGQQYIWLPMTSRGMGLSKGVELYGQGNLGKQLYGQASIAYSRARFSGLDGIMRSGNFDYPVVLNLSGGYLAPHHYETTFRYEYSSGRPYTPFLMAPSLQQDRGIYDVSAINSLRAPVYSRLDLQLTKDFQLNHRDFIVYAGVENALDRKNFLGYLWQPRCANKTRCTEQHGVAEEAYQIRRFPNFGIRYLF
jgi:hypothetical protein